jgi:hypothetical protein
MDNVQKHNACSDNVPKQYSHIGYVVCLCEVVEGVLNFI